MLGRICRINAFIGRERTLNTCAVRSAPVGWRSIKDVMRHQTVDPRLPLPAQLTPPSDVATAMVLSRDGDDASIATLGVRMQLPELVADAGPDAQQQTFEFFTARLPNPHTRAAYGRAVGRFCAWCQAGGLRLEQITPPAVAAYLEVLGHPMSIASIKLTASALRNWLGFLTERGVLQVNPATSVRTPRLVVREGKTPVLERVEARALFASLDAADAGDVLALRDRAVFAVMLFGFVRVGAVVKMLVRDFEDGDNAWLVLHEKGGRERRIPCHHKTRDYLRGYLQAAGLEPDEPRAALSERAPPKPRALRAPARPRATSCASSSAAARPWAFPPPSAITRSGRRGSPSTRRMAATSSRPRSSPATPTCAPRSSTIARTARCSAPRSSACSCDHCPARTSPAGDWRARGLARQSTMRSGKRNAAARGPARAQHCRPTTILSTHFPHELRNDSLTELNAFARASAVLNARDQRGPD